ncbi:DNA/RNA helicase domain-containing protein [Nocardiopsis sp. NPDC101807]|uniref:DNA/RNA helicase domain-containing protein n=1 Tax=Nocardiopsis sp. NPDC101807 TaxID=3364339 RepID=UPI00381174BE
MTAFRRSAASLSRFSPLEEELGQLLAEHLRYATGRSPSPAEIRSWNRSLPALATDLVDAGLGDVEVLMEYRLPLSDKRVDVVLAGHHPETDDPSYVVVELKQWSEAESWEEDPTMVLVPHQPGGPKLHPVLQVRDYCSYIGDFVSSVTDPEKQIRGAAYLHNAYDPAVRDLFDLPQDGNGRLFTAQRRGEFLSFLRSRLAPLPGAESADLLLSGKIRPSRQLMKVAAAEVKERTQFTLLDEQHTAFRMVMHAVERAHENDRKTAVIISGGPGSGKSVIALSLLGELSRKGIGTMHATGSKAFTETMRRVAGKRSKRVKDLFKYFNSFMEASKNEFEVLICDESHRIRETSANRYTKATLRTGRPQVDELLSAARVPVFLLDEHQVVRPGEMGTVETIRQHAKDKGFEVHQIDLSGQFRCGGSALYEQWVLRLLGLAPGGPVPWEGDENFTLRTVSSPAEMDDALRPTLERGYTARMSAGYCWPWSKAENDRPLENDVRIGDWERPWNSRLTRWLPGVPPSSLWATEEGGFDQVGCVYTAQGFEYDWSGVILGPDLLFRDGRLVIDRQANKDPAMGKKATDAEAEALIRNTYKVLLTRGMQGTLLYSTDPETQEFLSRLTAKAA